MKERGIKIDKGTAAMFFWWGLLVLVNWLVILMDSISGLTCLGFISVTETTRFFAVPAIFAALLAASVILTVCCYICLFRIVDHIMEKHKVQLMGTAKEQFMARMSHEMRTPINGIIGMNEMILRECDNEKVKRYADEVERSALFLTSLVNDFLDYQALDNGSFKLVKKDYELMGVIVKIADYVTPRVEEKDLEFNMEIDPKLPRVLKGDADRITQIIINLLDNSVKYTDKGRVFWAMECDYSSVGEFRLRITVSDSGIGISHENIGRIFDGYGKIISYSDRKPIEGTGLGLYIVKNLVGLMGGTIDVKSMVGKGTTFTVMLPLTIVDAKAIGRVVQPKTFKNGEGNRQGTLYAPKAHILSVDDIAINNTVITSLLKDTGINVDTALSGKECLEKARQNKYDVIFMDHMMPQMDGVETFRLLKTDELTLNRDVPVVALTANAVSGAKEWYLNEGFSAYLTKPIIVDELEQLLFELLPRTLIKKKQGQLIKVKRVYEKPDNDRKEESVKPIAPSKPQEETVFDKIKKLSVIDINMGLTSLGNEELYEEVMKEFCNTSLSS
ncbi:MAG: response regulator [Lachnospiraceae bacterium]|nr:response regulator [Lachnospiraceae bacterium]